MAKEEQSDWDLIRRVRRVNLFFSLLSEIHEYISTEEKLKIYRDMLDKDYDLNEVKSVTGLYNYNAQQLKDLKEENAQRALDFKKEIALDDRLKDFYDMLNGIEAYHRIEALNSMVRAMIRREYSIEDIIVLITISKDKMKELKREVKEEDKRSKDRLDEFLRQENERQIKEMEKQERIIDKVFHLAPVLQIALKLLKMNYSVEDIVKFTDLSKEDIEILKTV